MAEKIITVCYGKEDEWDSREAAEQFFIRAMCGSEGSEHARYRNVYLKLQMGMVCCTDDEI